MTACPAETALYAPVAAYLEAQGYTVRSEVQGCDVVGVRGDEVIVIELKRSLTLGLLAQGVRRQSITPSVYVAIPRPPHKARWWRQMRDQLAVVRRLELGLLLVATDGRKAGVDIVLHPEDAPKRQRHPKRRAILREVSRRSGDYNTGGSCRRKLVTGYRENAIQLASCLEVLGPQTPKALRACGTGEKTLSILARNVYGWFTRVERGVYALSESGRDELAQYPELAAHYRPAATTEE